MSHVTIPATGSGDATPQVATDQVAGIHFQQIKLVDGTVGGSQPAIVDANGNLHVAIASTVTGVYIGASVANLPATQSIQGYVGASVANLPGTQPVSIASYSVTQPISLASTSVTQPVSGNVTASVVGYVGASITNGLTLSGEIGASIANVPQISVASYSVTLPIAVASTSITQPVSGNVTASAVGYVGASITNFPGTQAVSGNVTASVAGYVGASLAGPITASVIGYVGVSTVPGYQGSVTGYVGASLAGPVTASVIGYVGASVTGGQIIASTIGYVGASVTNFPATQSVQGYVGASVANFPATQPVSGYLGASIAGGLVGASIANTPTVSIASTSITVGVSVANYPTNIGSAIAYPAAADIPGLGASPYQYITGASFNNVNVKNAAGTLYNVTAMNVNTSPRYLRLYDKASQPSPSVDIPRQTYVIPGASAGAGAVIPMPVGTLFAAGIGFAITGGSMGTTDTTNTGLGDVVLNLGYS